LPHPRLCDTKTNWEASRLLLTERLQLDIPLKSTSDIEEAINTFNKLIQLAGWSSTPDPSNIHQPFNCPLIIKQKLLDIRRLRHLWLRFRTPNAKYQLNKATRDLKQLLSDNFNTSFQLYLQALSPTASTDYSL
jgi:hypothetical protein